MQRIKWSCAANLKDAVLFTTFHLFEPFSLAASLFFLSLQSLLLLLINECFFQLSTSYYCIIHQSLNLCNQLKTYIGYKPARQRTKYSDNNKSDKKNLIK